jgi:hypothetical protein
MMVKSFWLWVLALFLGGCASWLPQGQQVKEKAAPSVQVVNRPGYSGGLGWLGLLAAHVAWQAHAAGLALGWLAGPERLNARAAT